VRQERAQVPVSVIAATIHDAALLAAVFYAPIYWGAFGSAGQSFAACLVAVALAAAMVARFSRGERLSLIPNAIHLPTLAFLGISALSALFSVSTHASFLELSRLTIGALFFALIANRAAMPAAPAKPLAVLFALFALAVPFIKVPGEMGMPLDVLTILSAALVCMLMVMARIDVDTPRALWTAAVAMAAFVIAVVGLREKIVAYYLLKNASWPIFATFFNPNPLGGFFAMSVPLALSATLAARVRWQRLLWGWAAFLLFLALLPTYSKGAAVGLLTAMLVYLVLAAKGSANPRRNLIRLASVLLVLAVLALGAVLASASLRHRLGGMLGSRSASNVFRLLTWKGTLNMAADHPWIGIGPGAFKHAFPKYAIAGYVEAAHENYLQILAEQGVFGAAAFLWLIGAILFTGWRAMVRGPDFGARVMAIGAICSLVVLLVHSLFDYGWYIGAINLYFWLLAGLLAHQAHGRAIARLEEDATLSRPSRRARSRRRHPAGGPRAPIRGRDLAAAAALALIAAGTVITSTRSALAERALEKGNTAVAAAQTAREAQDIEALRLHRSEALRHFQAAVDYDPYWPQALEQLGLLTGDAEGEEMIRRAVTLEPTDFQWRAALGRYYEVNGHLKEAIPYYQQALDRFPNSTRIMRRLAEAYQSLGDEHAALALYRRMIELEHSPYQQYRALDIDVDTEYAYAHYYLGRAAERSGRLTEAEREFQETLRVIGDYQYRGKKTDEMFAAVGRPKEPRAELLKVLEATARWRIANDYQQLGDPKTADIHRKLALSLLPEVSQVVAQEDEGEAR